MSENARSQFQVRDWRIAEYKYENKAFQIKEDAERKWKIRAETHAEYDDGCYYVVLQVNFFFEAGEDKKKLTVSGCAVSLHTYEAEESEKSRGEAEHYTRTNGMMLSLGMLRNTLGMQGKLLGCEKEMILPNVNLRRFKFDEWNEL